MSTPGPIAGFFAPFRRLCWLAGLTVILGAAQAQTVEDLGSRPNNPVSIDYVRLLWNDTAWVLTSPVRWSPRDWLGAGGAIGGIAASSSLDDRIADWSQAHRSAGLDRFARDWQNLGSWGSFAVLGGIGAWGWGEHDTRAKAIFEDGLASSLIASGIITPAVKEIVGRLRPPRSDSGYHFRPFTTNASFPSGHTTQAFAVASVIAAHESKLWEQVLTYGAAGLVGAARIEQNAHFFSDVVAGGLIGTVVGRAVVRHNDRPRLAGFSVQFYTQPGGGGLILSKTY